MKVSEIITELNELGGANGIGIIDIVENCAGMFSLNILWSRSTANWDNCDE